MNGPIRSALCAAAFLFLLHPAAAHAAPGDFDTAFGSTGIVLGPPATYAGEGVAIDRNEGVLFLRKVLTGPDVETITLMRLKSNGNVDTTFGTGGDAAFGTGFATSIALDRRRILVVGSSSAGSPTTEVTVRRYSEEGVPDTSFGVSGIVTIPAVDPFGIIDVQAQDDRKVVVVTSTRPPGGAPGQQRITLYRLTEAGVLDATFGTGGVVLTAIPGGTGIDRGTGLRVQPDGRIVVTGRSHRGGTDFDAVLLRYLANGALDPTFATGGILVVPFGAERAFGRRLYLAPDGRIVVTGTVFTAAGEVDRVGTFRVNGAGALDVGFGSAGVSTLPVSPFGASVFNIARQPDDKSVSVGWRDVADPPSDSQIGTVYRITAFGTLDTSWGGGGRIDILAPGFSSSNMSSVAIDDRERVVVVGSVRNGTDTRWLVARLKTGRMEECR
ncbi:delta-60 repeat domain-containing protein [Usitatibacter palustris]|uniref:Delta-60 repeat domain-containing protein n=1 Tax=Usitatibacter palustris TaxID=2732487 RepID=A0A6M4H8Y1_9PROT|nr:delta-60 repeat domain-containing protein [Usitatibacter palustris]QJR15183.1 hypothetical protein DSM104440_02000 [Usitatibacter palustris]